MGYVSLRRGRYHAGALVAYLDANTTYEPHPVTQIMTRYLNGQITNSSQKQQITYWREKAEFVDLATADRFLMRFGLELYDFEYWAEMHFGYSPYVPGEQPYEPDAFHPTSLLLSTEVPSLAHH